MEVDSADDSDTHAASVQGEDRQGLIDHYVTIMLQAVIGDPEATTRRLMDTLLSTGPIQGKQGIIELFRGRNGLLTTIRGLELVRKAARENGLGVLPVTTRPQEGWPVGFTILETEGHIRKWAPRVGPGGNLLFEEMMGMEGEVGGWRHQNAGEETEAYLADTEPSDAESRSDEAMGVSSGGD